MRASERLDIHSSRALKTLGENLRVARQRRKRRIVDWAQALSVGQNTVKRMESGDPSVSIGTYIAALSLIGRDRVQQLATIANPEHDVEGKILEGLNQPRRIRRAKRREPTYAF